MELQLFSEKFRILTAQAFFQAGNVEECVATLEKNLFSEGNGGAGPGNLPPHGNLGNESIIFS